MIDWYTQGRNLNPNATSVIMHPHSRTHNGEKSEQGPKLNLICGFAAGTLQQRTDQPAAVYQPESELLNKNKIKDKNKNKDKDSCSIPAGE